ncbi:MAG: thiol:disulfide interchange protein TlpA [Rhodoplanes sp.]
MTDRAQQPRSRSRRRLVIGAVGLLAAIAVVGAVYGLRGFARNPEDAACRPAADLARRLAPLARGELAALVVADQPRRLPPLGFKDAAGQPKTLADWQGRTVLLNLWATWCAPCRKEMPALDALERELGGPRFEVVAVNIDTRDPEKPKAWLAETGIKDLAYYADPTAKIFQDLKLIGKAFGMPTTLLLDPAGCEIASLAGPAEWASGDALTLLRAALASDTARAAGGS